MNELALHIKPIVCWWSGGVTSAVACKKAINLFGLDNCRIVFIDTHNEDDDTYRFLLDCEKWYGKVIERISVVGEGKKYKSIEDVWYRYNSLNVANGAICSSELKRDVRRMFTTHNEFSHQVFGFDIEEPKRARNMKLNNPEIDPIFTLLLYGLSKKNCITILQEAGCEIPRVYKLGYNNNNCFKTGCIQGGIGYWQKMKVEEPPKYFKMAKIEHDLTNRKGRPVTMLRSKGDPVFLLPHPDYPNCKDISMMKGRPPKPLLECNGFCGINDGERNETEDEINYQTIDYEKEEEKTQDVKHKAVQGGLFNDEAA